MSCLPLTVASLEEINYLLLVAGSVQAKVRIAIAASFAEIGHVAGQSLLSQLAPPCQPHCQDGTLGQELELRACHQADLL